MHFNPTITSGAVGNFIAVLSIGVTLLVWSRTSAQAQKTMHEQNQKIQAQMAQRVDIMFGWFERNIINGKGWGGKGWDGGGGEANNESGD